MNKKAKKFINDNQELVKDILRRNKNSTSELIPAFHLVMPRKRTNNNKINQFRFKDPDAISVSVASNYRATIKWILMKIAANEKWVYLDFSLSRDVKFRPNFNKGIKNHERYMNTHKLIRIHGVERKEMANMSKDLFDINSVSRICETHQTESNGTYSLILNNPTQNDLYLIDDIVENRVMNNVRKFKFKAFRKSDPTEQLDTDEINSMMDRLDTNNSSRNKNNNNNNNQKHTNPWNNNPKPRTTPLKLPEIINTQLNTGNFGAQSVAKTVVTTSSEESRILSIQ